MFLGFLRRTVCKGLAAKYSRARRTRACSRSFPKNFAVPVTKGFEVWASTFCRAKEKTGEDR